MVASTAANYSIKQKLPSVLQDYVGANAEIWKGTAIGFSPTGNLIPIEDYTGNEVSVVSPLQAPSVNPTGGGSSGGSLAAGTYRVAYTWSNGTYETRRSPFSAPFTVAAGDIPQVTIPIAIPAAATSFNIYITNNVGDAGSETLYKTGNTGTTANLSIATPAGPTPPPTNNGLAVKFAGIAEASVNNTGGADGTVLVLYSPVYGGILNQVTFNAVNPTNSWKGKIVYFTDDSTVALTSPNFIVAGIVTQVNATGATGNVTVDTTNTVALGFQEAPN